MTDDSTPVHYEPDEVLTVQGCDEYARETAELIDVAKRTVFQVGLRIYRAVKGGHLDVLGLTKRDYFEQYFGIKYSRGCQLLSVAEVFLPYMEKMPWLANIDHNRLRAITPIVKKQPHKGWPLLLAAKNDDDEGWISTLAVAQGKKPPDACQCHKHLETVRRCTECNRIIRDKT